MDSPWQGEDLKGGGEENRSAANVWERGVV